MPPLCSGPGRSSPSWPQCCAATGSGIGSVSPRSPPFSWCWHIPRPAELATANQQRLNVALFVPLGAAIAQIRPRTRAVLTAAAATALPFGIEAVQYAVPWLPRAADAQDIASNLLGLTLGMTALALPWPRGRSREPQRSYRERTAP